MDIKNIFRRPQAPSINNSEERKPMGKTPNLKDITVKVARHGSQVIEVALNGHRTVADALEAAGLNLKASEEVRVNGESVDTTYELGNGDKVFLAKNIEGGLN